MRTFAAHSLEDLPAIASEIIKAANQTRIFAFYGEMGVGKTSLIQYILKSLGVVDKVSSPTYSIVNEYVDGFGLPVYHFDFYRIEHIEEIYDMGYEEYLYSGNYCFIEWPEQMGDLLPQRDVMKIGMTKIGENRKIEILKA